MIRRVLARDDLLHLAMDVAEAATVVPDSSRLGRTEHVGEGLLAKALELHMEAAIRQSRSIARADHYECAATILEFCALPGMSAYLPNREDLVGVDAPDLYERAIEVSRTRAGLTDRWRYVRIHHKLARAYRLSGAHRAALDTADQADAFFNATGVGHLRAEFDFQWCAAALSGAWSSDDEPFPRVTLWAEQRMASYLRLKQEWIDDPAGAPHGDRDEHWTSHGQTRNRFEFSRALIGLASTLDGPAVERILRDASELAQQRSPGPFLSHRMMGFSRDQVDPLTDGLSLTLALAETAASMAEDPAARRRSEDELETAISMLERIRLSRHVIARSKGPFAIVLRRVLGDVASVLDELPGRRAAELGLQLALVAKHSGIAAIIRSQTEHLGVRIGRLVEEVLRAEGKAVAPKLAPERARQSADDDVADCERALEIISPILASWVVPEPIDVLSVIDTLRQRTKERSYVLDFVGLGRTESEETWWFRTLLTPDGGLHFDRVPAAGAFADFFLARPARVRNLRAEWDARRCGVDGEWYKLAGELLPASLLEVLADASVDAPVELLISPHGALNLLPWQALCLSPSGPRLVERAVVTMTPVLTAVADAALPAVGEPAYVHLVRRGSDDEKPLSLGLEERAWHLDSSEDVVAAHCRSHPPSSARASDAFAQSLADCGLVHIAAHGAGKQLEQRAFLPDEFFCHDAMQTRWPDSVLLAACHLGDDSDEVDQEPIGFAIAALIGGARCVVGARSGVGDDATDQLAARIVDELHHDGTLDLARALRNAQRASIERPDDDYRVYEWALFSAFVC